MSREPVIVAEIGCNHGGSLELALSLMRLAAEAGATVVKFQKRDPGAMPQEQIERPYLGRNSFGQTYGEHRRALELSLADHHTLRDAADRLNVGYACSVWDPESVKAVVQLGPQYIKVPSAENSNPLLLQAVREHWTGDIHVSMGMTSADEERIISREFDGLWHRVVLYACTSAYPTEPSDLALLEITRIKEVFSELLAVGFSGHHVGYHADLAALALGAQYIERHFTDDRARRGTDHAISLLPSELLELGGALRQLAPSLRYKAQRVLPAEQEARDKLKYTD